MKVAGFSVVSNECYPPERIKKTTHEDVVKVVGKSEQKLMELLGKWVDNYL
jgi:purine nucleoside phosphorylase